jgi:hypothetical protein
VELLELREAGADPRVAALGGSSSAADLTLKGGSHQTALVSWTGLSRSRTVCVREVASERADILVNSKFVTCGEIVTIENHYGVRITGVEP